MTATAVVTCLVNTFRKVSYYRHGTEGEHVFLALAGLSYNIWVSSMFFFIILLCLLSDICQKWKERNTLLSFNYTEQMLTMLLASLSSEESRNEA